MKDMAIEKARSESRCKGEPVEITRQEWETIRGVTLTLYQVDLPQEPVYYIIQP